MTDAHQFAMAVINLSVEELLQSGFTLTQIREAMEDYLKAMAIAERANVAPSGVMQ